MVRGGVRAVVALVAAAGLVASAGCGGNAEGNDEKQGTANAQQQAAAEKDGAAAGSQAATAGKATVPSKTIAFLNFTSQAVALRRVEAGMKAAAEDMGWKFVSCDAGGDPQKVASCASSFIQQNVDFIASVAIPQAAMSAQMEQAAAAGIAWISSGGQIPDNETLFAGSFFYPEAQLYKPFDDLFFELLGPGKHRILSMQLTVDSTARARREQLDADLKENPDITVAAEVEGSPADPAASTAKALAALQQHPDIDGIWSCCDIFNQDAVQAVQQAGLSGDKRPVILGPFPDTKVLSQIREGEVDAAVELPWEAYGWMAVDEAMESVVHQTPYTQHGPPMQYPTELYQGFLVTTDNVQTKPDQFQDPQYDYAGYFQAKWDAELEGR